MPRCNLPIREYCIVTHFLLVIGQEVMRQPEDVKCHSLPVGDMTKCYEAAFCRTRNKTMAHQLLVIGQDEMRLHYETCSVTHFLLVIQQDVMRLPENHAILLTIY